MKLIDIISDSTLAIIATVTGPESIEKAKFFMEANREVLCEFSRIFIHLNYIDGISIHHVYDYCQAWDVFLPDNVATIVHHKNAGHTKGTLDLDELCLKDCSTKYLWKSTEDILLYPELLNKEVEERDFYYLPGFSYESLCKASTDENFIENYENIFFTPQTNFFIINKNSVKNLYGDDVELKWNVYLEFKKTRPDLKPWELTYPDGIKFSLEDMLGDTTKNISKQSLLNLNSMENLIIFVKSNKIGDPSHKNIFFSEVGVSHYHHWKVDGVYYI